MNSDVSHETNFHCGSDILATSGFARHLRLNLPEAELLQSHEHIVPARRVFLLRLQGVGEQLEKHRALGEVSPACGE